VTSSEDLWAIDSTTGTLLWNTADLDIYPRGNSVMIDGSDRVYVRGHNPAVGSQGYLVVYQGGATLNELYRVPILGGQSWDGRNQPVLNGTTIYVNAGPQVVAIDTVGQTVLWKTNVGATADIRVRVAVSGDGQTIYACDRDGKVVALDTGGSPQWSFSLNAWNDRCWPVIGASGRIYIGNGLGQVFGITP
jgi:hypothetical protein